MQPTQDYKQLLSEVIKKQIVILGPDITLAKARNVPGLVVAQDGTVTDISGDQQQITQKLIDQFVQLSGEIVRKTMEPLLTLNQTPTAPAPTQTPPTTPAGQSPLGGAVAPAVQVPSPTPVAPQTSMPPVAQPTKPVQ